MLLKTFDLLLVLHLLYLPTLFFTNYAFLFSKGRGVTVLAGQVMIFLFILFLRWVLDKKSFASILVARIYKRIAGLPDQTLLFAAFLFSFLIFFVQGFLQTYSFNTGIDLAAMHNALWNLAAGHSFVSSIDPNINYNGAHFWPIAYLIGPLYMIWPNMIVLMIVQALAGAVAIYPLYFIARKRFPHRLLIFMFVFVYFIAKPLKGIIMASFHTDSFLITLALFAYLFVIEKKNGRAWICFLLMLTCKENAAFLVAGFGLFLLFSEKRYAFGVTLIVLGATWWSVVTNIVMPHLSGAEQYWGTSWLPFGETYGENIAVIVQQPQRLFRLFFDPAKLDFYLTIFGVFGYLSFLSPRHYVLFLLPLCTQVLVSVQRGFFVIDPSAHYQAHTLPFIMIAAIYGAGNVLDFLNKRRTKTTPQQHKAWLALFILIFAVSFHGKSYGHRMTKSIKSAKDRNVAEILDQLKTIPQEASVMATPGLIPHLAGRRYAYMWEKAESLECPVDYVVFNEKYIDLEDEEFIKSLDILNETGYKNRVPNQIKGFYLFYKEENQNKGDPNKNGNCFRKEGQLLY